MKLLKSIYFTKLFFATGIGIVFIFIMGYLLPVFYVLAKVIFTLWLIILLLDAIRLYGIRNGVIGTRKTPELLSNGDENIIRLILRNNYQFGIRLDVIEEVPAQLQWRNFRYHTRLAASGEKIVTYQIKPVTRGGYEFGWTNIFVSSAIGLVKRRYQAGYPEKAKVYPSVIQMKRYEFLSISSRLTDPGSKKVRKSGRSLEFDQIKEYIRGDDFRTVNWKATARRQQVMVNVYREEKAQNIYAVIDKGRAMRLPFAGMTLLDYAINSSLAFCNVALRKQDKAGLITFQHQIETLIPASRRKNQLKLILEMLYQQETSFKESDFSSVFSTAIQKITTRSLLLIYTNFESSANLDGPLPYLLKLARRHLLVVVFFENTELMKLLNSQADTVEKVYQQAIAEKFSYEKEMIVRKLNNHGIHTILTKPENLSVSVINKYLEIKSKQLL